MVPVRGTFEIAEGVKVEMLVTPRISLYQHEIPALPEMSGGDGDKAVLMERYADLMYISALNAWEIDGKGLAEDFPHKRGDFHGWMMSDPEGFAKAVKFLVCALLGKTAQQLAEEAKMKKDPAGGEQGQETDKEAVKKKSCWLSRIMGRSRRSS
jgi:hypothetical protein